jgi:hypothetical protein
MRCLSLSQPWASLVAIGAKRIETRSWRTTYIGPLAIHAAKALPRVTADRAGSSPLCWETLGASGLSPATVPRGAVIAVCWLIACISTDEVRNAAHAGQRCNVAVGAQEQEFGDYAPGRWAWVLTDIAALPEPIPARGALGLWTWQPPVDIAVAPFPPASFDCRKEE